VRTFGCVASKNKGQPRKKTIEARELAERRDSSRLGDNIQRLAGIAIPVFCFHHVKRDGVERVTRMRAVSEG